VGESGFVQNSQQLRLPKEVDRALWNPSFGLIGTPHSVRTDNPDSHLDPTEALRLEDGTNIYLDGRVHEQYLASFQSTYLGTMDVVQLTFSYEFHQSHWRYNETTLQALRGKAEAASQQGRDFWHPTLTIWWSLDLQVPVRVATEGGETANTAHVFGSPFMGLPGYPGQLDLKAHWHEEIDEPTIPELVEKWGK
jgi:hypothetical protein